MTQPFSPYGHPQGQTVDGVWKRTPKTIATRAALKELDAYDPFRTEGQSVRLGSDYSQWIFHPTSVAGDATEQLVLTPTTGDGRWLRVDAAIDLTLPITFETADGAQLFTVPVGCVLALRGAYWQVDFGFSGGPPGGIGLSSTNASYATKGDIMGGPQGDVAAALTWGRFRAATPGPKLAGGIFLVAGNAIRFDRVQGPFAAGSGRAHVICDILQNLGA